MAYLSPEENSETTLWESNNAVKSTKYIFIFSLLVIIIIEIKLHSHIVKHKKRFSEL